MQFAVQSRKLSFVVAVIISVSTVSVAVLQQPVQDLLGNISIRGIEVLRHDLNTLEYPNRPYVFNVSVFVCFSQSMIHLIGTMCLRIVSVTLP